MNHELPIPEGLTLRPCPFCGHEASAATQRNGRRVVISCSNESCSNEVYTKEAFGLEEAASYWNSRADTPKGQHAEGSHLLRRALRLLQEASDCFENARTRESVQWDTQLRRVGPAKLVEIVTQMHKLAVETVCEDCGKLMADCQCEWSNKNA